MVVAVVGPAPLATVMVCWTMGRLKWIVVLLLVGGVLPVLAPVPLATVMV